MNLISKEELINMVYIWAYTNTQNNKLKITYTLLFEDLTKDYNKDKVILNHIYKFIMKSKYPRNRLITNYIKSNKKENSIKNPDDIATLHYNELLCELIKVLDKKEIDCLTLIYSGYTIKEIQKKGYSEPFQKKVKEKVKNTLLDK